MSVGDNEDLVRRAYAAFSVGDVTTLAEIYAPDVVHVFPGTSASPAPTRASRRC